MDTSLAPSPMDKHVALGTVSIFTRFTTCCFWIGVNRHAMTDRQDCPIFNNCARWVGSVVWKCSNEGPSMTNAISVRKLPS